MTDEAINVAADAAPVADVQNVQTDTPVSSPDAVERDTSTRGAIERAFEAMEKANAGEEQPSGRERNPDGTFKAADKPVDAPVVAKPGDEAPKPVAAAHDAPTRFSADAKAAWATVPDAVKAETNRAFKELETGIANYQRDFEPYKEFDRQLKANGQTFKEVFDHYTGIEQLLERDLIKGLDQISRNSGYSLRQIAEHIMGQPADQQQRQNDGYVNELKAEIADLKKQIGGVTTTMRTQQEESLLKTIDEFAAKPEYSRFDELSNDIVFFLNSGKTKDLTEAYQLAERLNPAPQVQAPVIAAPAATQTAPSQTRKGLLSPSGAPTTGSNPTARTPPASAREAIDRAFAVTGF